jgi:hypothetical protein
MTARTNVSPAMSETDRIDLNLDTLERDRDFPEFSFALEDHRYTMVNPGDIDWKDLMGISSVAQFFKFAMSEDDWQAFREARLAGWKLNKLFETYAKHYGLDKDQLLGNTSASRPF